MADVGALLLAHAQDDHLHQPAFAWAAESHVGFDAVDDNDPVSLAGVFVQVDRKPLSEVPITTVSMVARIGTPTTSSVMPMLTSMSRWPSAVEPPWLPMAGTKRASPRPLDL